MIKFSIMGMIISVENTNNNLRASGIVLTKALICFKATLQEYFLLSNKIKIFECVYIKVFIHLLGNLSENSVAIWRTFFYLHCVNYFSKICNHSEKDNMKYFILVLLKNYCIDPGIQWKCLNDTQQGFLVHCRIKTHLYNVCEILTLYTTYILTD